MPMTREEIDKRLLELARRYVETHDDSGSVKVRGVK